MSKFPLFFLTVILTPLLGFAAGESFSKIVTHMDRATDFELEKGKAEIVPEGPEGQKVALFSGKFSGRIDLKSKGINPKEHDLLKVEVRGHRGSFLRFSLENYPYPGELSHWYVLSSGRGAFGWRTIWIDLRYPEEIKMKGKYKGMGQGKENAVGLQFMGWVADKKRSIQGEGRNLWVGKIRFAKKAIDLDWDQRVAPYKWNATGDLVYTYPLQLTNKLDRPVKARLSLLPFSAVYAHGKLHDSVIHLDAKEKRTVKASIVLPSSVAKKKEWLYTERFEARAVAQGIEDSEVTVLRSSDPIHLSVTVPIPEEKLQYPLFPRRKDLPAYLTEFTEKRKKLAMQTLEKTGPADLDKAMAVGMDLRKDKRSYDGGLNSAGRYASGLSSAAYLYDFTDEKKYLRKAENYLKRLAELFPIFLEKRKEKPVRVISHGIMGRSMTHTNFSIGGTTRPPYAFLGSSEGKVGSHSGYLNSFDLVAKDMDPKLRQRIINDFILPYGITARNHYFGHGNQQCHTNYNVLYAGLVARNWPLVAFAYSAEHGLLNQINWTFDDDGLCTEGHYQSYTICPILYPTELLYKVGIDLYDRRMHNIIHSKAAKAINFGFHYPKMIRFLDENRFAGKAFLKDLPPDSDGDHLTASTVLRWQDMEVSMNWGTHIMRSNRDRCALWIRPVKGKRIGKMETGGYVYSHSTFGQSCIIIDENIQNTEIAQPVSVDVTGPVQHVQVKTDAHFKGSEITRTFALVDKHVLVFDRVVNDRPRTVDWGLNNSGRDLSLPMQVKQGSFTNKPGDTRDTISYGAELEGYHYAKTDASWSEGKGRMTMLGEKDTEVLAFDLHNIKINLADKTGTRKSTLMGEKPKRYYDYLMVRRKKDKETNFVSAVSLEISEIKKMPVFRKSGEPGLGQGLQIKLKNGKTFIAMVNYEKGKVVLKCGDLESSERFACNYDTGKQYASNQH